jgi:hypothetical protein
MEPFHFRMDSTAIHGKVQVFRKMMAACSIGFSQAKVAVFIDGNLRASEELGLIRRKGAARQSLRVLKENAL